MLCKLWFALFLGFFFGYFRKCLARSEKLVYDYYGLWLGKPSSGQKRSVQNEKRTALIKNRNDPKLFWQLIKENTHPTNTINYISSDKWVDYFSNLLYDVKQITI